MASIFILFWAIISGEKSRNQWVLDGSGDWFLPCLYLMRTYYVHEACVIYCELCKLHLFFIYCGYRTYPIKLKLHLFFIGFTTPELQPWHITLVRDLIHFSPKVTRNNKKNQGVNIPLNPYHPYELGTCLSAWQSNRDFHLRILSVIFISFLLN